MRTVLLYTFASVIIVLNFDWNWKPKRKFGCATVEKEPAGGCGNAKFATINQPFVFRAKCAACHTLQMDATGPALSGVAQHLPGKEKYLELFVRNEDSLIRAKDKYAIRISESSMIPGHHHFIEISPKDWEILVKCLR